MKKKTKKGKRPRAGMKAGAQRARLASDFEQFEATSIRVPGFPMFYIVEAIFKFNRRIAVGWSVTEEGADLMLEAFRGGSDHWGEMEWIVRILQKLGVK